MQGKWHPALKSLLVPIDSLTPDPKNARRHPTRNQDAIRASLQKHGQLKPIITHDGVIQAGNGTWEQARALGWTHIAAVAYEGSATLAKEFAIEDNRSAELAEWDPDNLGAAIAEIHNAWEAQQVPWSPEAVAFSWDEVKAAVGIVDEPAPSPNAAWDAARAEQAAQIAAAAAESAKEAAQAASKPAAPAPKGFALLVEFDTEEQLNQVERAMKRDGHRCKRIGA